MAAVTRDRSYQQPPPADPSLGTVTVSVFPCTELVGWPGVPLPSPYVAVPVSVVLVLAANRTVSFAVPLPARFPTGQETVLTVAGKVVGLQPVKAAAEPLTRSVIDLTFTSTGTVESAGLEKPTLRTTCVAVDPPLPDSFVNFVIESASLGGLTSLGGEMKCGAATSFTHDALVVDGIKQMFLPAAVPPVASTSTATVTAAPVTPTSPKAFADTCRISRSPLPACDRPPPRRSQL